MAAIGDDRQKDVVPRLRLALTQLDRLDALVEMSLIGLEGDGRLGRDDLALPAHDLRHPDIGPQIGWLHHIGERPEHGDQFRHVDELGEPGDRLVFAGRLELQFGARVAECARPGIELVQAALREGSMIHQPLHREHLPERIGDRRAGCQHERPARVLRVDEPGFDEQVPGPLRPVRIDTLKRRHIGREREFSELLRLVDDDLVDADLGNGQMIILAGRERLQPFLVALLHALDALAREAVLAVDLGQQVLVEFEFLPDHLRLERRGHGNESEGGMRDNDRVPVRGCRARQEAVALLLGEIRLVGNEDAGVRVERQELAGRLRQAMAGHDQHGLVDQPETALLHDSGGDSHGLAGADGVRDVGASGRDDAPDDPFLVPVKRKGARGAWKLEMIAVEGSRCDVVERIVIEPRQPVGAIGVGPDPVLERSLDLLQLLLGRFRLDGVEHAAFCIAILHRVEDLRDGRVQRIGQELPGIAAMRPPFRGAGRAPSELTCVHRPAGERGRVMDGDIGSKNLLDEGDDITGWNPGCAETCGDVRRPKVGRLDRLQRGDIAGKGRIERRGGLGRDELGADGAREIGISRLPGSVRRIAKNGVAEFGKHIIDIAV